jgi:hypothetical protein
LRLISQAEAHLREDPVARPEWMDWFSATRLAAFKGNVELKAGQLRRAEGTFIAVLEDLSPDETKQRAVVLADLAAVHLGEKDIQQCCVRLAEALDEVSMQWYATAMDRIRDVRRALRPWQDEQCVRALDERLYDWNTAVSVLRS